MTTERDPARPLGLFALLALGLNGVVGVGIFFAPAEVAGLAPGRLGLTAYALTAVLLLPTALCFGRLGARFAEDGGPALWARRAFGDGVGFGVGVIAFVAALFSTSAVFAGLAKYLGADLGLRGPVAVRTFAAALVLGLGGLTALGLKPSAGIWSALTVAKLVPLVALAVVAAPRAPELAALPPATSTELPWRAALVLTFSLQGFEIVALPAGRVARPTRDVPLASVGALLLAVMLYLALHGACLLGVPVLGASEAPLVDAARGLGGPNFARLVAMGANVSALGICFGMLAMTPRYLAALGNEGGFGAALARERRAVPLRALAIVLGTVLGLVLLGDLVELFALSSVAVLAQFGVGALALVRLGLRRERGLGPLDAALGAVAFGAALLVARSATLREVGIATGAVLAGFVLRAVLRRR